MKDLSIEEIRKEQEEKAKERAESRKLKEKHGDATDPVVNLGNAPARLFFSGENANVDLYIRPVVPFEKFYSRSAHTYGDAGYCRFICSEHYIDDNGQRMDCEYHKGTKPKNGIYYPKSILMGKVHVYNLQANPDLTITDKETGQPKKVTMRKFVRRVEIPWGQNNANYNVFKNANNLCKQAKISFTDMIFKIKFVPGKEQGSGLFIETVTEDDLREKFGSELTIPLPNHSKVWNELSHRDLKKLYLSDWGNVNEEACLGPEPTKEMEDNPFATATTEEVDNLADIDINF